MLRHDELRETEDCFFDATPYASDNEWSSDAPPSTAAPVLARPLSAVALAKADAREQGRIMVIGFGVVRL